MSNARSLPRSAARLAAVQALYQHQMEGTAPARLLNEFHQHRLGREIEDEQYAEADVDFFDDLVSGSIARRDEIDALLTERLASALRESMKARSALTAPLSPPRRVRR